MASTKSEMPPSGHGFLDYSSFHTFLKSAQLAEHCHMTLLDSAAQISFGGLVWLENRNLQ